MLTPQGLRQRSNLLQAIRSFFLQRAYIEVDTPLRLPVLIPEANLIPFASEECFLQTSPELCMKRLLARGCTQIFQICHCFRKEELGRLHQPEFTMLEWYHKGWNYFDLMEECEQLVASLTSRVVDGTTAMDGDSLCWRGNRVSMALPWDRLTVAEAFERYAGVDVHSTLEQGTFDEVLTMAVEPHLGQERPVFLHDYPVALGSLARRSPVNPGVAERFELYVAGVELANGFSELVDPEEQRQRFQQEIDAIRAQGRTAAMPEKFLADLELLGDTAGIALGVDRLCMLLMGRDALTPSIIFAEL